MTTNKVGSPSTYTREIAEDICMTMSTSEYGLRRLCAERPHWPSRKCILEWRIKIKEFGDLYTKAKQDQVENLVDDILDIADDTSRDLVENENGKMVCNSEFVNRSRLRIDTRKWLAAKLAPRIYGEKIQNEIDLKVKQEYAIKDLA